MVHVREVYNLLDVMGDIGGILEISMLLFGFFIFPISEHSFFLTAARLQFFARTKNTSLFIQPNDDDNVPDNLSKFHDAEVSD